MVGLLVKIKSKNIENLVEWNKSTFNIRKSSGLIGVRAYKVLDSNEEYYALSLWDTREHMESYINDPNTQQILGTSVIEWFKEIEDFPEGDLGETKI